MIVRETSQYAVIPQIDRCILAVHLLIFEAGTVVDIDFVVDIPIVGKIKGQFIFIPFVIFGSILVEVVVNAIGITFFHQSARIFFHCMVVHGGIRGIINLIMPLVQPDTPGSVFIFARQFGSQEGFIYITAIQTRHAALYIAFIRSQIAFQVFQGIAVFRSLLFQRHRRLIDIRAERMVVFGIHNPFQSVVPFISMMQANLVAFIQGGIIEVSLLQFTGTHIHINHLARCRQVRACTQFKTGNLLHTSVAHIHKRGIGRSIRGPAAVAVMINNR